MVTAHWPSPASRSQKGPSPQTGETVKPDVSADETPQWFYTLKEFRTRLLSSAATASYAKHGTSQHLLYSSGRLCRVATGNLKRQKRHGCLKRTDRFRLKGNSFSLFIGSCWHLLTIPEHCRWQRQVNQEQPHSMPPVFCRYHEQEHNASSLLAEKSPAPTCRKFCFWPWIKLTKRKPNEWPLNTYKTVKVSTYCQPETACGKQEASMDTKDGNRDTVIKNASRP